MSVLGHVVSFGFISKNGMKWKKLSQKNCKKLRNENEQDENKMKIKWQQKQNKQNKKVKK